MYLGSPRRLPSTHRLYDVVIYFSFVLFGLHSRPPLGRQAILSLTLLAATLRTAKAGLGYKYGRLRILSRAHNLTRAAIRIILHTILHASSANFDLTIVNIDRFLVRVETVFVIVILCRFEFVVVFARFFDAEEAEGHPVRVVLVGILDFAESIHDGRGRLQDVVVAVGGTVGADVLPVVRLAVDPVTIHI